jgi:CubicO group peptidase (beta-lactamase class C family)
MAAFTSGYRGIEEGDTPRFAEPAPPYSPPNAFYHYSQATDQLAYLLTIVAQKPLKQLFKERIADPIGIDPNAFQWNDWGTIHGHLVNGGSGMYKHGLHTSARQMAKIGWLLTNHGTWNGKSLISANYLKDMLSPQCPPTTPPFEPDSWYKNLPGSYGLNIWLNGTTPEQKPLWPDAPKSVAAIQGNMNNICFIIPDWKMTVVRLGTDGRINNSTYTNFFAALREAIN